MNPESSTTNKTEGTVPCPGPMRPHHAFKLNPDEMRVMKECKRESFWKRSVPMGTAFGLAAYIGVNAGYLKKNPKYGAIPKVVMFSVVGYFLGKFSYQYKCVEKLMQQPNSQIGEMLRNKRRGFCQERSSESRSLPQTLNPSTQRAEDITPTMKPDQHGDVI